MRKRLDTRFPAARIKKIMQADEDVGKIALAVPLLVSKALELFLQDLCDRTYEITLKKGAKTMNSFHLKHCIQSFNVFDFLKDVVSRVPDLGGSDAGAESATKRRKVAEEDDHYSDDDIKRNHMNETANNSGTGRGRGRGRRGRGRGARAAEKGDSNVHSEKLEDPSADVSHQKDDEKPKQNDERMVDHVAEPAADSKNILAAKRPSEVVAPARNFDLNIDLNESVESTPIPSEAPSSSTAAAAALSEVKHEEIPGWSLSEMEKMAIDPIQLANLNRGLDEEEEDYDEG